MVRRWRFPAVAAAMAAALMAGGCGDPYLPTEPEAAGAWCSTDGDVLTLNGDRTFSVDGLSRRLAELLLPQDGYVDDYRIQRDYGGKVPGTAAGTWEMVLAAGDTFEYHSSGVFLNLQKVGPRTEDDTLQIYFDGDESAWGFAVEHGADFIRYFDRCPAT